MNTVELLNCVGKAVIAYVPTCVDDCDHCATPDIHDRSFFGIGIGYCKENDFFVTAEDTPETCGCEDFREC